VDGVEYDEPDPGKPLEAHDARLVRVRQLLPDVGRTLLYDYDFTAGWRHLVRLDQIRPPNALTKIPFCVDGAGAPPPEQIAGPFGYVELVAALREPDDPWHAELLAEIGGSFDPAAFDPVAINAALSRLPRPR
jgi:hypothetical protein